MRGTRHFPYPSSQVLTSGCLRCVLGAGMLSGFLLRDGLDGGLRVIIPFLSTKDLFTLSEVCTQASYFREFVPSVRVKALSLQPGRLFFTMARLRRLHTIHLSHWDFILDVLCGLHASGNSSLKIMDLSDMTWETYSPHLVCTWLDVFARVCRNLRTLRMPAAMPAASSHFVAALQAGYCPYLRHLELQDSMFLGNVLASLPRLQHLILSGSTVDMSVFTALKNGCCSDLRTLDLRRCQMTTIRVLLQAFEARRLSRLETLILSYNDISADNISALGAIMAAGGLVSLRALLLQGLLTTEESLTDLMKGVLVHRHLEHLDLSNNFVGSAFKLLSKCAHFLHRLELRATSMNAASARRLGAELHNSSRLTYLDVSDNAEMDDEGLAALVRHLDECPLTVFASSYCSYGPRAKQALAYALPGCEMLSSIDISSNFVGTSEGLAEIVAALPPCIERLNLRATFKDFAGTGEVEALVHKLTSGALRSLTHLYLEDNYLAERNVLQVARAVSVDNCPNLLELRL